ncbi:MAG: CZB domain-containing protein [Spirochaetia bacterium]|nr:CZB domain-containing protein [Spirochaetia bacterium]
MDLEEQIDKHAEWNVKFRKAIVSEGTLNAEEILKDDACEMGKWIYGEARTKFSHLPGYEDLKKKHAEFHEAAGIIAKLINEKKYAEAKEKMSLGTPFSDAAKNCSTAILLFKNETEK